ncbi:MAG: Rieske (2Fe-2S) protein [Anaerolineae bacterium]
MNRQNRRDLLTSLIPDIDTTPSDPPAPAALRPIQVVATAGSPRQYPRGSCVLVQDAHAWLCRDDGGFYAVDAICPHLGGDVRPLDGDDGFTCRCHRSRFDALGGRISGPAPRGLRFFYLDLSANGDLLIVRARTVDPRDRLMA